MLGGLKYREGGYITPDAEETERSLRRPTLMHLYAVLFISTGNHRL